MLGRLLKHLKRFKSDDYREIIRGVIPSQFEYKNRGNKYLFKILINVTRDDRSYHPGVSSSRWVL